MENYKDVDELCAWAELVMKQWNVSTIPRPYLAYYKVNQKNMTVEVTAYFVVGNRNQRFDHEISIDALWEKPIVEIAMMEADIDMAHKFISLGGSFYGIDDWRGVDTRLKSKNIKYRERMLEMLRLDSGTSAE